MTDSEDVADLDRLREDYPAWTFSTVWASAGSGPDARRLTARKDAILLTAWEAGSLRENIQYEEARFS
jgi:hypothetical protein